MYYATQLMHDQKGIHPFFQKKRNLFWMSQFVFWFANWGITALLFPQNTHCMYCFFRHLYGVLLAFGISLLLRVIHGKYKIFEKSPAGILLAVIVATIISSIVWVFLFYGVQDLIAGEFRFFLKQNRDFFMKNLYISVYPFFAWNVLYLGFKIYEQLLLQKQNLLKAELLAQGARLETLRYQVNPHFLFNTLNSVRTLVQIKPLQAQEMLTQISDFLRYSLAESHKLLVPLEREMEAIRTYLEIEKIRYKENLMVDFQINPDTRICEVPVFLILPLIENAIKHGMRTTVLPLKIQIKAVMVTDYLFIEITNSGKWIDQPNGNLQGNTGTGLINVERRLENTWPGCYTFEIKKEAEYVQVILKIKQN